MSPPAAYVSVWVVLLDWLIWEEQLRWLWFFGSLLVLLLDVVLNYWSYAIDSASPSSHLQPYFSPVREASKWWFAYASVFVWPWSDFQPNFDGAGHFRGSRRRRTPGMGFRLWEGCLYEPRFLFCCSFSIFWGESGTEPISWWPAPAHPSSQARPTGSIVYTLWRTQVLSLHSRVHISKVPSWRGTRCCWRTSNSQL